MKPVFGDVWKQQLKQMPDAELWKMRKDATYDKAGKVTKNGQVIRHSGGQTIPGKEATADAVNAELKRRGLLP